MELTLQSKGKIKAVCISSEKHVAKTNIQRAVVKENHGLLGDAHASEGHRQVSIIDLEHFNKLKEEGVEVSYGAFGENFVIEGLSYFLSKIAPGSIIKIGDKVVIEVTQIGKLCHDRCAIYKRVGNCPMSSEGIFGRVLAGGDVAEGDPVTISKIVPLDVVQCGIIVVSDRCFRGETEDTAGKLLKGILEEKGFNVLELTIVPDEEDAIAQKLIFLCDERGADVVFTAGGTGLSPRDRTPEATLSVLHKQAPGISEAIRIGTASKTPRSMLSRGVSGIRGKTLIINLPGSEKGVKESIEIILPVLEHAVFTLRGEVKDCGR